MVFRIELAGISSNVGAPAAAAAGAALDSGLNFSMSCLVILPPGPVPLICLMGTPRSSARALAEGLALGSRSRLVSSLPPEDSASCGSGGGADLASSLLRVSGEVFDPESGGSEDCAASSFGASFGGAFSPPASSKLNDSKAATSSPSSIMTAIGYLHVSASKSGSR